MSKEKKEIALEDVLLKLKKIGIIVTATTLITSGALDITYRVMKDNPYDGTVISTISNKYRKARSKSFLDDDNLIPTLFKIDKLPEEKQDAYLLYYSIISNYSLTKDVKKELKNYIDYIVDNPYIDHEYVYGEFQKLISKKVLGFTDKTVLGMYDHDTHVIKYKYLDVTFHELLHADSKDTIPLWFDEGLSALIDDEYNDCKYPNTYGFYKNVIRILCEIIGKERARQVLFICEAEGNIDLLKEELYKLNLPGDEVNKLFETLDMYHIATQISGYFDENYLQKKGKEIKETLAFFYDETHKDEEYMYEYVSDYFNYDILDLNMHKIYYLNTEYISKTNEHYEQIYYYPYDDDTFEKIQSLRTEEEKERNFSSYIIFIDGKFYFQISEKELELKDLITPDNVILKVKRYFKDKSVIEYMKHENGNFVIYNSVEEKTSKESFYRLVNSYKELIKNKGGKKNG